MEVFWEIIPTWEGGGNGFHKGDSFYFVSVVVGPVEADAGTPVVKDEGDVFLDAKGFEKSKSVFAIFGEGVAIGGSVRDLLRVTHTNHVDGDEATTAFEMRHDIAPEIGRGRVAVKKDDGVAGAFFDISHLATEDGFEFFLVARGGGIFTHDLDVLYFKSILDCG